MSARSQGSVSSMHLMHPMHPAAGQSRSRRPSTSSSTNGPPEAFRIEDTYYDTTPLPGPGPTRVPSIGICRVNQVTDIGELQLTRPQRHFRRRAQEPAGS